MKDVEKGEAAKQMEVHKNKTELSLHPTCPPTGILADQWESNWTWLQEPTEEGKMHGLLEGTLDFNIMKLQMLAASMLSDVFISIIPGNLPPSYKNSDQARVKRAQTREQGPLSAPAVFCLKIEMYLLHLL